MIIVVICLTRELPTIKSQKNQNMNIDNNEKNLIQNNNFQKSHH